MELSPDFSRLNPISVVLKDVKKEVLFFGIQKTELKNK